MNGLKFYFDHSLAGYFYRRAREKWGRRPANPRQLNYHGVELQLDCLPPGMQNVLLAGHYELPEIELLPGFVTATDRVLEIGGAIGFLGLYCRKVIQVKELVSVEPNPQTLTYFRRNYELNQFKPVVIEAALTAADGPISFHVSDMFWADSLVAQGTAGKTITVEGLTFDSMVSRAGIEFNTLIIDIEGGEEHLPVGNLPKYVSKVVIEVHPDLIGVRRAYTVLEQLIRAGFSVRGHKHHSWALIRE